jgi:hypothetical protein
MFLFLLLDNTFNHIIYLPVFFQSTAFQEISQVFIVYYRHLFGGSLSVWFLRALIFGIGIGINAPKALLPLITTEEWLAIILTSSDLENQNKVGEIGRRDKPVTKEAGNMADDGTANLSGAGHAPAKTTTSATEKKKHPLSGTISGIVGFCCQIGATGSGTIIGKKLEISYDYFSLYLFYSLLLLVLSLSCSQFLLSIVRLLKEKISFFPDQESLERTKVKVS